MVNNIDLDLSAVMASRIVSPEVQRAREDVCFFEDYIGSRLEPDWIPLAPFQKEILHILESDENEILILWPRAHGKSTDVTQLWAAYRIGKDPNVRIGIASNTLEQQAGKFLGSIERIMKSKEYISIFGNLIPASRHNGNAWTLLSKTVVRSASMRKDPTLQAIGAFGASLGSRVDILIVDDLVDQESATGVVSTRLIEWFYNTLLPCLEPSELSKLVLIGTRWAEGDLYDEVMKRWERRGTVKYVGEI